MFPVAALLLTAVALPAGPAPSASGAAPAAMPPEVRDHAPVRVYELHLAVDIPVMVAAGSVGLARILWRDRLARQSCPCDPARLNALDRPTVGNHSAAASTAGDVTAYGLAALLPILDLFDLGLSRAAGEDLVVYAETLAVNTALQNMVNFAVARPRPLAYAGDPAFVSSGEGYLSFYAGHVSTAFAAMSAASFTLGRRYHATVWPWVATFLVAGSVGVERVASGHHFPTDVTVAAAVGTTIGIAIPWMHAREIPLTLAPASAGSGLSLAGSF